MPTIWVDADGRVRIPKESRELIGIKPRTKVVYDVQDKKLILQARGRVGG